MALRPAATNRSSSLNEVASSAVHPSTLPPNIRGAIRSPDLPSARFSIRLPRSSSDAAAGHRRLAAPPPCGAPPAGSRAVFVGEGRGYSPFGLRVAPGGVGDAL